MHLLFRGRLKLLAASLVAVVLLTWLYLLAGNLESEFNRDVALETNIPEHGSIPELQLIDALIAQ